MSPNDFNFTAWEEQKMKNVLEIKNLSKTFGKFKAVDNLSFSVKEGELFAFLGVNGAGKSTTISSVCGLLKTDSGDIFVCGKNIKDGFIKPSEDLGVVFQNSVLDVPLTVIENLENRAGLYGISKSEFKKRLNYIDDLLNIAPLLSKTVGKLSGGQRRKIDIARALINNPRILILDEPTTGLDPMTRKTIWRAIEKLRVDNAMSVLLTTHYMEEAADADYVVIIDSGKIAAEGTPLELKNKFTGDFITFYKANKESLSKMGYPVTEIADVCKIAVPNTAAATKLILEYPQNFTDYEITKGKMDDVFLAVTGKHLKGERDK